VGVQLERPCLVVLAVFGVEAIVAILQRSLDILGLQMADEGVADDVADAAIATLVQSPLRMQEEQLMRCQCSAAAERNGV